MMTDEEVKAAKIELAQYLANHRQSAETKLLLRIAVSQLEARDQPPVAKTESAEIRPPVAKTESAKIRAGEEPSPPAVNSFLGPKEQI